MKKPIIGNYNWTPQQMARVNAQREARGQAPLASYNGAQESPDYDKYYNEIKKRSGGGIKKSQYDLDKEKESGTSLSKRIKGRDTAFEERFRKKQMLPQGMSGMKSGVSYPASSSSYARRMA
jgi:hypothetical protein